jgi:hypothetical protein
VKPPFQAFKASLQYKLGDRVLSYPVFSINGPPAKLGRFANRLARRPARRSGQPMVDQTDNSVWAVCKRSAAGKRNENLLSFSDDP